jgi:DNA-binding PadR family transcriptional regulator
MEGLVKEVATGKRLRILQLLIHHGEMTGGQLAEADETLASPGIYTTLVRMEHDSGLLKSRKEKASKHPGPPARYYSITGLGQRAAKMGEIVEAMQSSGGRPVLVPGGRV